MATPYKRGFVNGRGSEMLFNDDMHQIYESIRHLTEDPGANAQPEAKLDQSVWHDRRTNKLFWWDKTEQRWREYYEDEHRITGEIMSILPPTNPVYGQLWLHNGVLCYFDGSSWNPIKALLQDGSQFSLDVFKNFMILSPLWQSGNTCVDTADIIARYDIITDIVKIEANGYVEINVKDLDIKHFLALVRDDDQSSKTYGSYINSDNILTVSYMYDKTRVYNSSSSDLYAKLIYHVLVENESASGKSRLSGINYELITSEAVEEYKKQERMYLQNVLDTQTDSSVTGDGSKWLIGHNCISNEPTIPVVNAEAKSQLLVPQIDYDRIFLDRDLDTEKYEEVSKVCIQYKRKDIVNHIPTLVHLNPGRLTKIAKRIIKVDRDNPKIMIPSNDTEYYGFKSDSSFGELLVPDSSDEVLCDYTVIDGGILLSYNACQNFDYVLSIHYEFSWYKSTGKMSHVDNSNSSNTYAIDGFNGAMNMFIEGYDVEDPYFTADAASETVTFKQDVSGLEVSAVHSPKTEYGYIRHIDIKNNAIIRPLTGFSQGETLVFVNGELVHPVNDGMAWNPDGSILIPNGKQDMMWSTVSLRGFEEIEAGKVEEYVAKVESGVISNTGDAIPYTAQFISSDRIPIVFIDGLLVAKEEIVVDEAAKEVSISNTSLNAGQEYVIVEDKFGWFYDSVKITPALSVGKITDTLVYMNGKLLCNSTAIDVISNNWDKHNGVFNEVKCFKTITLDADGVTEIENRNYKIYDSVNQVWNDCSQDEIDAIKAFAYSYENARKSVHINISYTPNDNVQIYAFNTANSIEHTLEIYTIMADNDHPILSVGSGMYWNEKLQKEVPISSDPNWTALHPNEPNWNKLASEYIYGKNTLRVWCNGVRQYPYVNGKCDGIKESLDGLSFKLPKPFVGQITYIVELPENDMTSPCSMEVLDHTNIKNGYINFYKTEKPLFPGRVTLYINGIRQPKDAYTIFDNYTLLINDSSALIGCKDNYPIEAIQVDATKKESVSWPAPDRLLVEVRQDDRTEVGIKLDGNFYGEIFLDKYDLDPSILEASDEILFFVNGLFTSAKLHDGYKLNIARNSVMITDPDINNAIRSDGEYEYLIGHPSEHAKYLINNNNVDYEPKETDMIIEWR